MKLTSLEKSLKLIDMLSRHPEGMSLADLSQTLGYPKSTTHHILSTFLPYDYVAQNPETRKYALGFKFLSISKIILDNIDIRRIAQRHLRQLHEKCGETVHLAVLRHGQIVYLEKIDKPGGLSLATYVGFTTDPHAAAGGKVLLSEMSDEEIGKIYRNRSLKNYGKNTITTFGHLLDELQNVRKQGYAIDNEEYYEGVRCVAAPVRAGGRIAASVSITGSIFTMTMERINRELIEMVIDTGKAISAEMKW